MNHSFRVTKKFVKELLEVLDEIAEEIRQEKKEKLPLRRMGAKEGSC